MSKFGPAFEGELKHYVVLGQSVRDALKEGTNLLLVVHEKNRAQELIASLAGVVYETHLVAMRCLQGGEITSGIHMTRLVQEAVHKMMASHLNPRLADKGKLTSKRVRREMRNMDFPDWGPYHGLMSSISHVNDEFLLGACRNISVESPANDESIGLVDEFLSQLNILGVFALSVVHGLLDVRMGSDFKSLKTKYDNLEVKAMQHHAAMLERQDYFFSQLDNN